jgi:Uma2 family endonuclease
VALVPIGLPPRPPDPHTPSANGAGTLAPTLAGTSSTPRFASDVSELFLAKMGWVLFLLDYFVEPRMSIATLPELTSLSGVETDDAGERLYEIIDGQRVEMPPMSASAGIIAAGLAEHLILHNHQQNPKLGRVFSEYLFRLPLTEKTSRNRRPDIAFVSFLRGPIDQPPSLRENAWNVVPDLAVEVISPNDLAEGQLEKILEYFQAGVRLVWVIYPIQGHFYVYQSPTQVEILTRDDTLDGGPVLPGFSLRLDPLFDLVSPRSQSS